MFWHKVTVKFHWTLGLNTVRIGDKDIDACPVQCSALVDSGTYLITFEKVHYEHVMREIGTDYDCDDLSSLPDLTFVIED